LQDRLIDSILEILRPGGRFVTFAYLQGLLLPAGHAFSRKLQSRFRKVKKTRTVWRNLPPAFVYVAEK
jgi:phospholipid N-methyltransferase